MQTIYLDISNKGVIPCIMAKQSEVGRKFLAIITDNGVPYNIPDNSHLSVWYEGDTDAGNYSSIDDHNAFAIDGNKVTVELVAQMLLKPGNGELCLSVTHGDGGETNTWNITYCVEYKPGAGSTVPTEYYTALTEAGAVAAQAAGEAKIAAEEAKEAVNGYVKLEVLESLLLSYQERKTPVGYTFEWSPVDGSGYDLSTPEKVAAHFGFGTWEQIVDRFIVGAGGKYEAGATGGNDETTLTVANIPAHTHYISVSSTETGEKDPGGDLIKYDNHTSAYTGSIKTANTGGGASFSIMPPYVAMYIWKRVA